MIDDLLDNNENLLNEAEGDTGKTRDELTFNTNRITYIKRWIRRKDRDITIYIRKRAKLLDYMKSMMKSPNGNTTGQIMADDLYKTGQDCDVVEFVAETNYRFRPSSGGSVQYAAGSSSRSKYRGYLVTYSDRIKAMYCTCDDFFYRVHGHMYKAGLVLNQHPNNMAVRPHTLEPASSRRTYSSGDLMLCKHLYAAVTEIL